MVDEDIDVFSGEEVEWAMAARFHPEHDLVVAHGLPAVYGDPALPQAKTTSKIGFDAVKLGVGGALALLLHLGTTRRAGIAAWLGLAAVAAAGLLVDFRVYAALYFLQAGRRGRPEGTPW